MHACACGHVEIKDTHLMVTRRSEKEIRKMNTKSDDLGFYGT